MPNNKKIRSQKKKKQKPKKLDLADLFVPLPCYHGSSEDAFVPGNEKHAMFRRCTEIILDQVEKGGANIESDPTCDNTLVYAVERTSPDFGKFLLAVCTEVHLKRRDLFQLDSGSTDSGLFFFIRHGIRSLYDHKIIDAGEHSKRVRDVITPLAFLKCLEKSIPCDCLLREKRKAKKEHLPQGFCLGCATMFPRDQLHLCNGCHEASYCGAACQKGDWPEHKDYCLRVSKMNE